MCVYIDQIIIWPGKKAKCFNAGSCHLTADTLDELHLFAEKLGLKREWYQDHPLVKHYDLTVKKRALALQLGAIEMSFREQKQLGIGRRSWRKEMLEKFQSKKNG